MVHAGRSSFPGHGGRCSASCVSCERRVRRFPYYRVRAPGCRRSWSNGPLRVHAEPPLEGSPAGIGDEWVNFLGDADHDSTAAGEGEWSSAMSPAPMPRRPSIRPIRCSNRPRRSPTLSRRLIPTVNKLSATDQYPTDSGNRHRIHQNSLSLSHRRSTCVPNADIIVSYHGIATIESIGSRFLPLDTSRARCTDLYHPQARRH